jgi:predicted RNase H-like HicB family nuclease
MEYIAYLHKDKDSDFGVSFPDLPGCVTGGTTLEEARRMAAEALALHLRGMEEDGEAIPEASTLDQLANDPALRDAVAFLVRAELPERTVRFNLTARQSLLDEIDRRAALAGMTRSGFMVQRSLAAEQGGRASKSS